MCRKDFAVDYMLHVFGRSDKAKTAMHSTDLPWCADWLGLEQELVEVAFSAF